MANKINLEQKNGNELAITMDAELTTLEMPDGQKMTIEKDSLEALMVIIATKLKRNDVIELLNT